MDPLLGGFQIGVWAPNARSVELVTTDGHLPMEAGDRGYWHISLPDQVGLDYRFSIDGGEPRPDPRSPFQPHGIDGVSRKIDQDAFDWSDGRWSSPDLVDLIVYELHVGTFTAEGTFANVVEKLDHLVELGVNAIELMPVAEFSGDRGWGYDGVDLYAPHHAYGEPDDLKWLVDTCHSRGVAVILDVVYNHLGPSGNYLREFGPYFTHRYATPWGEAINLDGPGSDEVRAFFIDNALTWLADYHFDGLRLDAVHAIVDTSAVHLLEELATRVAELAAVKGRNLFLIAESDLNDPRVVTPHRYGGYGMDAQWSDDFHHAVHAYLTGERAGYYADFGSLSHVAAALSHAYVYDGRYSSFRDRRHGRPIGGLRGSRFLAYAQNHDQIGNRATGDRLSTLVSIAQLKIVAALVLTAPFVPMLFQGEEWAASTPFQYFTDHADPQLAHAVSRGRRHEFESFGWSPDDVPDPQDEKTFLRSKLDWTELNDASHAELLAWHRDLIALRRSEPALRDGDLGRIFVDHDEDERWLTMHRGDLVIAVNFADEARSFREIASDVILASSEPVAVDPLTLGPQSVAVVTSRATTRAIT
ncbi:MAG: maltooligosyltrehalose trehalohydrolase [Actinomycetota bacterium]|nr:maltooligosyltrehalose trehalohydrolase [Actinomycetota bacterium]